MVNGIYIAGVTNSYQLMKTPSKNYLSSVLTDDHMHIRQFSQRPDMLLHKFLKITYSQPYQIKCNDEIAEILLVYSPTNLNIWEKLR